MIKFIVFLTLGTSYFLVSSLKLNENVINILSESNHFKSTFKANINNLIRQDSAYLNFTHHKLFNCDVHYNDNRTEVTVHSLRPSDIKLIGAFGDSLTAGLGACATILPEMLSEYRGVSWSIGGDNDFEKTLTMPNILKKFSPQLTGYSIGDNILYSKGNELNRAVSGDRASDLANQAAGYLDMLKSSKYIDYWNEWKVLTVFIGANDLCESCKQDDSHLPANFVNSIRDILGNLKLSLIILDLFEYNFFNFRYVAKTSAQVIY